MSWHEITLGDAIHVKHGFAFKSQYFSDSGEFVVLTPGNFDEVGGFRLRPRQDRFYTGDIPEDYVLNKGDLIIAMTEQGPGLLGSSALVPESGKYLHNQRLGLIQEVDDKILDRHFLYYLFNTSSVRGQINGSATGTKVRHTAPDRIYRVKVTVPKDVGQQRRIVSILSAYDDLIDTNRRRIRVLEQTAGLIYKEWFIRLRFPGRQQVPTRDGVPEGWERRPLGEVAPLSYGRSLKTNNRLPGSVPVYGSSGVVGTHNNVMARGPTIIVGRKGIVGSVYWSSQDCFPIDTVYYIHSENCSLRLYHALRNTPFISTDVAVPGLNRNFAHSRLILTPSPSYHHLFENTVAPFHQQIDTLRRQNIRLESAREILLPCLMNRGFTV